MRRRRLVAAVAAPFLLAGCGGDDSPPTKSERPRLSIEVTDPSRGRFEYIAPKSVEAGVVEIRLTNGGDQPHKAQLWRVGRGHSVKEALAAGRPLPKWLHNAGGVGLTAPKQTGVALQRLLPGLYYVAGAGNERGRVASFRVRGRAPAGKLPKADAVVSANEYSFRFARLRAGRQRVLFRNDGGEPHHAFFAPIRPGATFGDVRRFLDENIVHGRPPVNFEEAAETAVLEGRERQVTELELQPGRYAVLCFVSDRTGGPSHVDKGMVDEVTVK